jgi:ketosteroid isomerase-like protein
MRRLLCIAFVASTGALLGQTNRVPAQVDPAEAITLLREGLIDSFSKGDINRLLTYVDTNVVVTWQNGEVCRGPNEVRAYYDKMMKGDPPVVREIRAKPEVLHRQVYGDWAVSTGNLHDYFILNDGSELPFNTLFTATIARRSDRWLVTAFHASVNVFDNPVLSLAIRKVGMWAAIGGVVVGVVFGLLIGRIVPRRRRSSS